EHPDAVDAGGCGDSGAGAGRLSGRDRLLPVEGGSAPGEAGRGTSGYTGARPAAAGASGDYQRRAEGAPGRPARDRPAPRRRWPDTGTEI
ncbi:MAG: hypothetical protein AVDCRST_MAG28-1945, partial [uncultured Rubrobacteraceae bacterium]